MRRYLEGVTATFDAPARFVTAAFDALSANVAILDEDGVIVAVNRAWRTFARENGAHANGGDDTGQNYLAVCEATTGPDGEYARGIATGIRAVLAGREQLFELEYPCHAPHEPRYFLARVTAFVQDGGRFAVVAHENVTRRKLAELELQKLNRTLEAHVAARTAELAAKNTELEASNRELAQFAYVASHDLQEPLRTVGSFADLLRRRYTGQLDDQADVYLNHIGEGVGRMRRLIHDLLSLARVDGEPLHGDLDVGALFQEMCLDMPALRGARVELLPAPPAHANRAQVAQVLINLLGNAAKFRSEEPLHVSFGGWCEGEMAHYVLRDNGIGIAPEHLERIFGMFQRLHGRARFDGNGIGLAICQKIVERHGGRIWAESGGVESGEAGGSAFHFTLPAAH